MSWKCYLVEEGSFDLPVGAMWYGKLPEGPGGDCLGKLSDEYYRDNFPKRPPIIVMLPQKAKDGEIWAWPWCVDGIQSDPPHVGWTVTGDAPNITVHPSIHAIGTWHGWLQNGELIGEDFS
jgi:hypothetical protein